MSPFFSSNVVLIFIEVRDEPATHRLKVLIITEISRVSRSFKGTSGELQGGFRVILKHFYAVWKVSRAFEEFRGALGVLGVSRASISWGLGKLHGRSQKFPRILGDLTDVPGRLSGE